MLVGPYAFPNKNTAPDPIEFPDGRITSEYSETNSIGWPFLYLDITTHPKTPPTKVYHYSYLALNVVFIVANFFGVIYSAQTFFPRYSIISLMFATTFIAVSFAIGRLTLSSGNPYSYDLWLLSMYLMPIGAAIAAFVYSRYRNRFGNAG